jgi:hypothetical protein
MKPAQGSKKIQRPRRSEYRGGADTAGRSAVLRNITYKLANEDEGLKEASPGSKKHTKPEGSKKIQRPRRSEYRGVWGLTPQEEAPYEGTHKLANEDVGLKEASPGSKNHTKAREERAPGGGGGGGGGWPPGRRPYEGTSALLDHQHAGVGSLL